MAPQNPILINSTNFCFLCLYYLYHEKPQSEAVDQPPPVGILQVLADTMFHLVLLNRTFQGVQSGNSSRYQVRNREMPPPWSPGRNIKRTQKLVSRKVEKKTILYSTSIFTQCLLCQILCQAIQNVIYVLKKQEKRNIYKNTYIRSFKYYNRGQIGQDIINHIAGCPNKSRMVKEDERGTAEQFS